MPSRQRRCSPTDRFWRDGSPWLVCWQLGGPRTAVPFFSLSGQGWPHRSHVGVPLQWESTGPAARRVGLTAVLFVRLVPPVGIAASPGGRRGGRVREHCARLPRGCIRQERVSDRPEGGRRLLSPRNRSRPKLGARMARESCVVREARRRAG